MQNASPHRRRDRRPTRRSAGGQSLVPRVPCHAMPRAVGDSFPAEFGRCGQPQNDRPRCAKAFNNWGIRLCRHIGCGLAAIPHIKPVAMHDVLDRNRHTIDGRQRLSFCPPRLRIGGFGKRTLMVDDSESIQRRIDRLCPAKTGAGDIDGRNDTTRISTGQRGACGKAKVLGGTGHGCFSIPDLSSPMLHHRLTSIKCKICASCIIK